MRFVAKCDDSDVATSATSSQEGCPVAFISRLLQKNAFRYPERQKACSNMHLSGVIDCLNKLFT